MRPKGGSGPSIKAFHRMTQFGVSEKTSESLVKGYVLAPNKVILKEYSNVAQPAILLCHHIYGNIAHNVYHVEQ